MRHFLRSGAVAALALGVLQTPPAGLLVATSGSAKGGTACLFSATVRTVDIAPIALAADHHLTVAAGAVVQACSVLHRRKRPMRT